MSMFGKAISKIKNSSLFLVYNTKTDDGKGRLVMTVSGLFSSVAANMTGGLFYSAYFLEYGLDKSAISILMFLPYFTVFLSLLSPVILEQFQKRKGILVVVGTINTLIGTLGMTLLPNFFAKDAAGHVINLEGMKLAFILITVFTGALSALFSSGYGAWHANFLPDYIRTSYFTINSCISSFVTYVVVFGLSALTDKYTGTDDYLFILTLVRYIAVGLALVNVFMQLIPKEYPYPKTVDKPRIKDVFTLPVKNKPFFMTVMILTITTFAMNIHQGYWSAHLLEVAGDLKFHGIGLYSLDSGINALYFAFFIMFGSICKKLIAKQTWFRALGFILLFEGPSYLLLSMITRTNFFGVYIVARLWQHIAGVIRGTITSSLPYVNLPETDRTNYLTFHSIAVNLGAFAARLAGLLLYEALDGISLGFITSPVTVLVILCGALEMVMAVPCFVLFRKITPKQLIEEYDMRKKMRKQMREMKKSQKKAAKN